MNSLTAKTQRSVWPTKNPAFAGLFYRGAEIRTRDLTDPNGARYQAAPRPDVLGAVSHKAPALYVRPMTTPLSDILAELDRLLEPERFSDYGPNGLQVPGATQIERIATGVSAHAKLFELTTAERAQLLIVHHGLFWGSGFKTVDALLKRRLRLLFDADISLAAYHLPLDAHPELGNNALLAKALRAETLEPFARHEGETIGFLATLPGGGLPVAELIERVSVITDRTPLLLDSGPAVVKRLAIVSGAGSGHIFEAAEAGADALLTGEPSERVTASARELGIHLIAAGHHATETFGVKRLGEHLAERFGLEHVFIDVPNPI
jgi:dinuclear metal center YbgI/SA1388 family protein